MGYATFAGRRSNLRANQLRRDAAGAVFFADRGKTGTPAGGALSARSLVALQANIASLADASCWAKAPIFRTRGGDTTMKGGRPWIPQPYAAKHRLAEDFQAIRGLPSSAKPTGAPWPTSGARVPSEAIAGDATPAALAHAMGNTLKSSNALFATYVPVNVSSLRAVAEARRRGRTSLGERSRRRSWKALVMKVELGDIARMEGDKKLEG
jgi:hypothetical protein